MRRRALWLLPALAVVAAAAVALRDRGGASSVGVATAPVVRRSFSVAVRAVGELDAARSTIVCCTARGNEAKIIYIIENGARVEKDEVLVRLDPSPFESAVARHQRRVVEQELVVSRHEQALQGEKAQAERQTGSAEFDLRAAELDLIKFEKGDGPLELARLRAAAQKAKAEAEQTRGYAEDLKTLVKDGFSNAAETRQAEQKAVEAEQAAALAAAHFENYRDHVQPALLERARRTVDKSRAALEQGRVGARSKVAEAEAAVNREKALLEETRSALKEAEEDLRRCTLKAPIPGMAVLTENYIGDQRREPRIGDTVWYNQPLLYLPDVSQMTVKTQVREVDLHKVGVGKTATVTLDAYPDLRLPAKVTAIGVLARPHREFLSRDKFFQVTAALDRTDPRLRPGMTAQVEIQGTDARDALCIPLHAVFIEEGRECAYVDIGASFERREIKTGLRNEQWIEALQGLQADERVALSRPPADQVRRRKDLPGTSP